jgi:nucleoside-diphosphate-sugar epimerase
MKLEVISILGCGWLGFALGKELKAMGFQVKGSVTVPEKFDALQQAGISPFQLFVSSSNLTIDDERFFECDGLIISIPPRRIAGIEQEYPAQIGRLIPLIKQFGIKKVLFFSSTSVYPEQNQTAREEDVLFPDQPSGIALLEAENSLRIQTDFKTTILRFGGLIGADRNPARFMMSSKFVLSNAPVNLIHQDDCIGIIQAIINQDLWGETLNACSPEHPSKKEFYEKAALMAGLPVPAISDENYQWKKVDSNKLIRLLNYQFKYQNPIDSISIH